MTDHYTKSKLRSFGLIVGGIFLLIAFWPYLRRGHDVRLWATVLGGSLVLLGIVAPSLLRHPYRAWMALAYVLGWINTRLILGVVYYLVFTARFTRHAAAGQGSDEPEARSQRPFLPHTVRNT